MLSSGHRQGEHVSQPSGSRSLRHALIAVAISGCSPGAPEVAAPLAAVEPAGAQPGMPSFDIGDVVRQVHFAFRAEGGRYTGGDRSYAVRVGAEGGIEIQPIDRRDPARVPRGATARLQTVQV